MMADGEELLLDGGGGGGDDDDVVVFVYTGGRVPENLRSTITHARVDKSVKIIDEDAFEDCINLLEVETHNGITKMRRKSFCNCLSLRGIKLPGVRVIAFGAFQFCTNLTDAEF